MLDVLIIAHFTQVPGEAGNGRFHYIASKLAKNSSKIEVVTTSFSHRTKLPRNVSTEQFDEFNYNLTLLKEPGYKKNVSLRRFYSHYIFARNLRKYLKTRSKPDVIYCAVPSLDAAKVAASYARMHNVRFIIDIQDLWPEAFKMVFNMPVISDFIFYPMQQIANYIYRTADEVIAVSDTYKERALKVNTKVNDGHSIYLGTDLETFDEMKKLNKFNDKPSNEIWFCYVGTLGHSYDLTTVIDALEIIQRKDSIYNLKFIVMGDGPLRTKFEEYAKSKQINALFTGRLSYNEMVGILGVCDIAVNPITKGAAQSIINKHGDYAAAGLPVINTQESLEYKNLVSSYNMGLNCNNNDPIDLAEKLVLLLENEEMRINMGKNSRRLAEEKFDRRNSYNKIMDIIYKFNNF